MSVASTLPVTADRRSLPQVDGRRRWLAHVVVAGVALALAVYVTHGLWQDPYGHVIAANVGDQAFFEWALSYGQYALTHGQNPLFTTILNTPAGVNLAANTSVTTYAVVFAPLTRLAGPQISFATILTLNLAGSAFAWYLFLARWVVRRRLAAAVGGLFCGFAPGFISHANSHLNWTSGWIAPVALWLVFQLRTGRHWWRRGLILGLFLAAMFTVAAEGLFFTALASAVFVVVWSLGKATRAEARAALPRVSAGLGLAAAVAGALLAWPLYMHFAGPQTFGETGFDRDEFSEDLGAYVGYSDRSLAGLAGHSSHLWPNPTEVTSYFGPPLVLLVVVGMIVLWWRADPGRRATVRALAVVGVVFTVISLGPRLHYFGEKTDITLPYELLADLPLFDAALPLRFALVVVGVFGVVLALILDEVLGDRLPAWARAAFAASVAVALVPVFPLPLLYTERAPEPRFISSGAWQRYVPDGGTLSALPFAANVAADGQRWQAYTLARGGPQFRIPDGYFLGPEVEGEAGKDGKGRIGAPLRTTDWLLLRAAFHGTVANVTDRERDAARQDFAHWNITAVFLPDEITGPEGMLNHAAVQLTATRLLGSPEHVDDVLLWRIRPGVDPLPDPTQR